VIGKILEALFRHKLLILLPPVLIPLLAGGIAVAATPPTYEAWAGVWVSKPTYLTYADDWNQYVTPAQNQTTRLSDLLKTASFIDDVAKRTSLASLAGTPTGQERLQALITAQLAMLPSGNNLLAIRYRASNPQLASQVLEALLEAYKERTVDDRTSQGTLAISFYESRLADAQQKLSDANDKLRRYLVSHARTVDPSRAPASGVAATDPQAAELQHAVEAAQHDADGIRSSLEKARLDVDASLEAQDLGFQVVDEPRVLASSTRDIRRLILFPVAGLLGGIIFSVGMLVTLVAGDRSIRAAVDLVPPVRIVGTLPSLKMKGLPKRDRTDATRRAIGFPVGTVLALPKGAKS
jgi:uncharacterized protein involved in exopolysaccharide biosynthesis